MRHSLDEFVIKHFAGSFVLRNSLVTVRCFARSCKTFDAFVLAKSHIFWAVEILEEAQQFFSTPLYSLRALSKVLYEAWSVKHVNIRAQENQTVFKKACSTDWCKFPLFLSMVNFFSPPTPAARWSSSFRSRYHCFQLNINLNFEERKKIFENAKNAILQFLWFSYFIHNISETFRTLLDSSARLVLFGSVAFLVFHCSPVQFQAEQ